MIKTKKGKESPGTGILFEKLTKKTLDQITTDQENHDVYFFLHNAVRGRLNYPGKVYAYNEMLSCLILRQMGLINLPDKMGEQVRLTDTGKEVYKSLVGSGAYSKFGWYSPVRKNEHT